MSSRVACYFAAFAVMLTHNMIFPVRGQPTVQDSEHKDQLTIELFGQLNKQVQSIQDLLTESMQDMKNQLESVRRSLDQRLNEHDISIKNQTQNSWKLAIAFGIDLGGGPIPLSTVNDWIVIMNRFNGSVNFNRNWTEYKNGFGDIGGEFWLGNEKIHRLTNRFVYTLRIEVQLNTSGGWYYADYAIFSIDSESNYYALRLSGYSGNAGDSLSNTSLPTYGYHVGMNFTTLGRPGSSCANSYAAGWWFNNCWHSCLTCQYGLEFKWYWLTDWQTSGLLRAARMMIKSK